MDSNLSRHRSHPHPLQAHPVRSGAKRHPHRSPLVLSPPAPYPVMQTPVVVLLLLLMMVVVVVLLVPPVTDRRRRGSQRNQMQAMRMYPHGLSLPSWPLPIQNLLLPSTLCPRHDPNHPHRHHHDQFLGRTSCTRQPLDSMRSSTR